MLKFDASIFGGELPERATSALPCARGSASHTHASFANHSCSVRQIGQWTRAKKTGIDSKLLRSVTKPVGMSRPVCGHLTMTAPIGLSCLLSLCASDTPLL